MWLMLRGDDLIMSTDKVNMVFQKVEHVENCFPHLLKNAMRMIRQLMELVVGFNHVQVSNEPKGALRTEPIGLYSRLLMGELIDIPPALT